MIVYLSSPRSQQQAEHLAGMPVLLSYACYPEWINKGYQQSFSRILIDSGAFSEFSSGKKIDLGKYAAWAEGWVDHADAIAGLDDISGNWRRSLKNYEAFPIGFPTFHESDPFDLLNDLVAMAKERRNWLGLGLIPPRDGKENWIRDTIQRIPEDIHIHGWAMRKYTYFRRINSVDSTSWWRKAIELRCINQLSHLTYGECISIVVKKYQRWKRTIKDPKDPVKKLPLFDNLN